MAVFTASFRNPVLVAALVSFTCSAMGTELEPITAGPYPVGSSNLAVSVPAKIEAINYLNGKRESAGTRYLSDILSHPESALITTLNVPAEAKIFGPDAGAKLPVVMFVFYPTSAENVRPDYRFPYTETGDNIFPHMQGPQEGPTFAAAGEKYPLIVYSGGYNTHGLWHLEHMKALASHGYIVLDVFHGDNRCSSYSAAMALRPLEFKAALDYILAQPDFAAAIDATRIGASGASAGGHTILSILGGIDPQHPTAHLADARVKAGFGVVPYMGGKLGVWPFVMEDWRFGEDRSGLRGVRAPILAVYGQKDTKVPPDGVEAGVSQMSGPATAVMLDGESHDLSSSAVSDINTWEILFFDAWLKNDPVARQQLAAGSSVRGGVHDHKTLQRN